MERMYDRYIFPALLSVCLIVPISIDIFISGLPAMSLYFPGENVTSILSMALLGLALSQPVYGPLLDRFGRKPVLVCGLWIYTIASIVVMSAHSFNLLMIARFMQAAGGCSAVVTVFAIARDRYDKERLIYATSIIMATIGISPIIAPLVGSYLNSIWGWRASFVFLFALGLMYTLLVQIFFKETLVNKNLNALRVKQVLNNYILLARTKNFPRYCFASGLSYCVLFSYLSLSAFFIIQQFNFSLVSYGWIVAINAIAIITMAMLAPKLAKKITLLKTMYVGFSFIMVGGLAMLLVNLYCTNTIYTFMLPMFLTTIGAGIIRPTASASAMQLSAPNIAGSAAAFFNFITFTCGSLASAYSIKLITTISEFGFFIIIMGLSALFLIFNTKFSLNVMSLFRSARNSEVSDE